MFEQYLVSAAFNMAGRAISSASKGIGSYLFDNVSVIEKDANIHLSGFLVQPLLDDIRKYWGTSKLEQYMFSYQKSRELAFRKFFAIEMLYIVEFLISKRYTRVPNRILIKIRDEIKTNTWVRDVVSETSTPFLDQSQLKKFKFTPKEAQQNFFDHLSGIMNKMHLRGYLLDAAAGTGKSFSAMAVAEMLHSDTVIVVSPKNALQDPWVKSVTEIPHKPFTYWDSSNSSLTPEEGKYYYLIHYEYLGKFLEFVRKTKRNSFGQKVTIILDESHNMNESGRTSDRTENFIGLCNYFSEAFVLWMSGTPLKAIGKEMIPLLKTTDPLFDTQVEERFRQIFGKSSSRANDILAHRLGLVKFTIPKSAVIKETPNFYEYSIKLDNGVDYTLPKIRKVMYDFITERIKYYKEHDSEYVAQYLRCLDYVKANKPGLAKEIDDYFKVATMLRKSYDPRKHKTEPYWCNRFEKEKIIPYLEPEDKHLFRDARSVYKYVELKVQGEALGRVFGGLRTQCIMDMTQAMGKYVNVKTKEEHTLVDFLNASRSKSVIFTSYVPVLKKLYEELKGLGIGVHAVYAETNKNLASILEDMREKDEYIALIATYDSLSTAVPLTMCSTVINLNYPFREYERNQSIARAFRLGQPHQVDVIDIVLDTGGVDNISTRSKDIMEWSKQQVEQIMGKGGNITLTMEDLFDHLIGYRNPEVSIETLCDLLDIMGPNMTDSTQHDRYAINVLANETKTVGVDFSNQNNPEGLKGLDVAIESQDHPFTRW